MIDPFVAIEKLVEQAQVRIDLHNAQPFNRDKQITLADTIEGQACELISHLVRELEKANAN